MTAMEQSSRVGTPSPWHSAHLFYHGDLDALLTELVGPMVDELCADNILGDWFYLRYWDGGPHVRLRVLPAPGVSGTSLRERITRRAGTYLHSNPSNSSWTDAAYRKTAKLLAGQELMDDYSDQLYPNNTVAWIAHVREFHRYGTGDSILAAERHFCDSSRVSLDMVRAGATKSQRLTACFVATVLAWLSASQDRELLTRRASGWSAPVVARATKAESQFAKRYDKQRDELIELTERLVAQASARPAEPLMEQWWVSVTRLRTDLEQVARVAPDTLPMSNWSGAGATSETTFEQTTLLPMIDLCAHLFCNRMGILLHEESYLRYLAGHALADFDAEYLPERGPAT